MTDFSQQEQPDSVHQTAPVPSEVFTTRESLRERCEMFVRCLPQAPMRDRLARLFEDLLAHQWRPIETAPTGGGPLLLWVDTDDGGEAMTLYRDADGTWLYDGEPTCCASFYIKPTHWMPLPDAPHHRSAVGAPGSDKPESESESDFAALRAVPHQPTGERK